MHFASPASPIDFERIPIQILKVGGLGTHNCLGLAKAKGARFFLASTSEVYGDPQVHPQPETYWGNVNPIGPRGVYDEAKRFAEAITMAYHRHHGLDVRIVRIFNTYGPLMRVDDGRSVSNFLVQALRGEPITVFGDGSQTRSFCYVDDEVRGFLALLDADITGPVNIGNPERVHDPPARRDGRRGHRLVVDDHVRAAAGRRPDAAPARPHAGPPRPRAGSRRSRCARGSSGPPSTSGARGLTRRFGPDRSRCDRSGPNGWCLCSPPHDRRPQPAAGHHRLARGRGRRRRPGRHRAAAHRVDEDAPRRRRRRRAAGSASSPSRSARP